MPALRCLALGHPTMEADVKVTDEMVRAAMAAFVDGGGWADFHAHRRALEAALAHVPEPDAKRARGMLNAYVRNDGASLYEGVVHLINERDALRARIAELEAQLARIGKDMPEMLALCDHKDNRIAELEAQAQQMADVVVALQRNGEAAEAQLARVRDLGNRWEADAGKPDPDMLVVRDCLDYCVCELRAILDGKEGA